MCVAYYDLEKLTINLFSKRYAYLLTFHTDHVGDISPLTLSHVKDFYIKAIFRIKIKILLFSISHRIYSNMNQKPTTNLIFLCGRIYIIFIDYIYVEG